MIEFKKSKVFYEKTSFDLEMYFPNDVLLATLASKNEKYLGVFNFSGGKAKVLLPLQVKEVRDEITGDIIPLRKGTIVIESPVIIKIN